MEEFVDSGDVKRVKDLLKQRPIIVLFFSSTCPHCVSTKPHWKELYEQRDKYDMPGMKMISVGDSAIPDDEGVAGVPHFRKIDKSGKITDVIGEKSSAKDIANALGLKMKSGGLRRTRRRHSRRLRNRVRKNNLTLNRINIARK
jgi:thiol-disulfide isomerase/thioredoxin